MTIFMLPAGKVQLRCRDLWNPIFALPFPGGYRSYITSLREETDVPEVMYSAVPEVMDRGIPVAAVQEEPPAPRTYFPETWLWDLVPVG